MAVPAAPTATAAPAAKPAIGPIGVPVFGSCCSAADFEGLGWYIPLSSGVMTLGVDEDDSDEELEYSCFNMPLSSGVITCGADEDDSEEDAAGSAAACNMPLSWEVTSLGVDEDDSEEEAEDTLAGFGCNMPLSSGVMTFGVDEDSDEEELVENTVWLDCSLLGETSAGIVAGVGSESLPDKVAVLASWVISPGVIELLAAG